MPFYLYRLYINRQGYDTSGAYWGVGAPLYQYCSVDGSVGLDTIRAYDRDSAKVIVRRKHPSAVFTDEKGWKHT